MTSASGLKSEKYISELVQFWKGGWLTIKFWFVTTSPSKTLLAIPETFQYSKKTKEQNKQSNHSWSFQAMWTKNGHSWDLATIQRAIPVTCYFCVMKNLSKAPVYPDYVISKFSNFCKLNYFVKSWFFSISFAHS